MAGEATIGALRVILGADTAKFEDNLRSALGSLQSFGEDVLKIATGINLAHIFEQAGEAIKGAIDQAIESADKLAKAGQKFGIPTEALQVLAHQAELSDISLDSLGTSLAKLSKNMIAGEDRTSAQAAAFQALGLSVQQLIKLSPDQAFLKIADAISKYADGTGKTAAVQAIFTRDAANLIPILNKGSAGFEELRARMQETGQLMSGEAIASAERFKDSLKDLEKAKTALIIKILGESGLLDALTRLIDGFLKTSNEGKSFAEQLGNIDPRLETTVHEFQALIGVVERAAVQFKELGESMVVVDDFGRVISQGTTQGAKDFEALGNSVDDFVKRQASLSSAAADFVKQWLLAGIGLQQLNFSPETKKNVEAFNKEIEKLRAQAVEASGVFAGQLAPGFLAAAAHLELLKNQVDLTQGSFAKLGPQAQALNQALLQVQGEKLVAEALPLWDQLQKKFADAQAALQAVEDGSGRTSAALQKAALDAAVAWGTAIDGIAQNVATGFAGMASANKRLAGAAKAVAITQATISTFVGAAKALELGPILGPIAAAAQIVAGLGLVARITAQTFAAGGSFKVPGGFSGVDSVTMPITLARGEQVDITRASEVRDRGRNRVIELAGIGPRDLFTGSMLRDLVDVLNQGARDGYKLKIAS